MPLCQSKVEQVTTEDLVELSEIEKHNLGQVYAYSFHSWHCSLFSESIQLIFTLFLMRLSLALGDSLSLLIEIYADSTVKFFVKH